jgi:tRNA dimethylallyltransferase
VAQGRKKAIIILGPTASGKTDIAIRVATRLDTEIISADSRQCYREMAIGTAKPTPEELARVRHHFVDAFPVSQNLTAADFQRLADGYLNEIFSTRETAIICGGTGLYIKAFCDGLDDMPDVDDDIKSALEAEYQAMGMAWLQARVAEEDPEFWASGEVQNPARMLRALSFRRSSGTSIVAFRTNSKRVHEFDILKFGIHVPRETLYARINDRVDRMVSAGLFEEAERLYPLRHRKNLQTVGYTEIFDYMDGKTDKARAIELIKQNTRHYAKRQMTWFLKDKDITWLDSTTVDLADTILNRILTL